MSSLLRKQDRRPAIVCPNGTMWLQGFEPSYCQLCCPGRKYFCGEFFTCDKCKRAFRTCKQLRKHCKSIHCNDNKRCRDFACYFR